MAFMMNKLAMIISCELFLKHRNNFFAKNHCEIQVRTILVRALNSIKYGSFKRNIMNGILDLLTHVP